MNSTESLSRIIFVELMSFYFFRNVSMHLCNLENCTRIKEGGGGVCFQNDTVLPLVPEVNRVLLDFSNLLTYTTLPLKASNVG